MYNPFSLEGKNILVTGASSGIGEASAVILSKLGANLIITGRNQERLEKVHSNLDMRGKHSFSLFDMQNVEDIPKWVEGLVVDRAEALDGVFHAAGFTKLCPVRAFTKSSINNLMDINFVSSSFLLKICSNKKITNRGASIVFVSSSSALVGSPGNSIYSASKAALDALVRASAVELAPRLRVNSISPALVQTPLVDAMPNIDNIIRMHPLGIGQPNDVANAAAYLLSDAAKWVTGSTLRVDGGYSISK